MILNEEKKLLSLLLGYSRWECRRWGASRQVAIRECQEEVGLVISLESIIHEDSNIDNNKIFTRLVYSANLLQNENINIKLDPEEHVEYKWIKI